MASIMNLAGPHFCFVEEGQKGALDWTTASRKQLERMPWRELQIVEGS
jgi:hypothetical protein